MVVAGYGSWAMAAVNPAAEVVAAFAEQHQSEQYHLRSVEVPVDSEALYGWLEKTLQEHKPDIWIGIGVAVSSPAIRLEKMGINIRCFNVPDATGLILEPTSVFEDGPTAYCSNLNHEPVIKNLRTAGIPAVLSFHAGTHLCNQMLYSVMHLSTTKGLHTIVGFVHVPQSTDNVARANDRDSICSSMGIPMMKQAIAVIVDCAVQQFNEAIRPI